MNKVLIIIALSVLLLPQITGAQQPGDTTWTRTVSGNAAYSVQQTTDGGFIIAGNAGIFQSYNLYLAKTDASGDTLWTRTLENDARDATAYSVQQTSDDGYIIAGSIGSYNEYDFYLVKTNTSGDTIWTRKYDTHSSEIARSVKETRESGYIVAGLAGTPVNKLF